MKNLKIQEMSNEALLKRQKTTQVVTATLAGLLAILLMAALFLCINQRFSVGLPLLVIPLSLCSVLYMNIHDVRVVKRELQSRNQLR